MKTAPLHLVLGATGQIGSELVRVLPSAGRVVGLSRPEVDLERPETVRQAIRLHRPSVIWNAAAATAVDALEEDPALASRVNAKAPGAIAEEAKHAGATLVHFSTDYVFDGTKIGPYLESDPPNPINTYGRSKLEGELAVRASGARHLILRTSWIYSSRGQNFVGAILDRAAGTGTLRVVNDQIGAPTWSRALARACAQFAGSMHDVETDVLHITARGACSWFEFASALRTEATRIGLPWNTGLDPVTTVQYGAKARRPLNSILSNAALFARFGVALSDWQVAFAEFRDVELGQRTSR